MPVCQPQCEFPVFMWVSASRAPPKSNMCGPWNMCDPGGGQEGVRRGSGGVRRQTRTGRACN
eukprot:1187459-Prorocentrum_minimum.AAC.3